MLFALPPVEGHDDDEGDNDDDEGDNDDDEGD